jgi:hypothetical protein
MHPSQSIHQGNGLESDKGQSAKTMLSRDDHGRNIRNRKQRTDVGKHSFVNRTATDWNVTCRYTSLSHVISTLLGRVSRKYSVTRKEALRATK